MTIKKLLIPATALAVVATAFGAFTMTTNGNSLESLSASAGTKCVEQSNSDCKSPSTGTIFNNYTRQNIGDTDETEDVEPQP